MASWKSGDQVVLISGGPTMTVDYTNSETAHCKWFSGKKMEHGNFKFDSLKAAPDDDEAE